MLLVIILKPNGPYGEREEIKTPSVAHTAEVGDLLIAYNGSGEKVAQFNREDVRNYHLEKD